MRAPESVVDETRISRARRLDAGQARSSARDYGVASQLYMHWLYTLM